MNNQSNNQITNRFTQTERKRLDNNWNYAQKLWCHRKKKYKLHAWTLVLFHSSSKAGMCSYNKHTIYLSSIFMRGHNCDYEKVKKTLMHEIAHVLKPGHGHGKEWKKQCQKIGGDDRLAVTMVLPGMNWAMSCPRCKWRQEYSTKPVAAGMVCNSCKSSVIIKYIT